MEIIKICNKHKEAIKPKEYGCVCIKCNSIFIFNQKEICIPRMISVTKHNCSIKCPNNSCNAIMSLDNKCIVEFTKDFTKNDFIQKYKE